MDKIQQIISLNKSGFNAEQIKNIFKALDEPTPQIIKLNSVKRRGYGRWIKSLGNDKPTKSTISVMARLDKALDENGQLNKEEVMQALGIARSTATRTMHRASFLLPNVHTMKEKNHLYVYKERK